MKFIKFSSFFILFVLPVFLFAQSENIDQAVMSKIRNEGLQNSKVMDIAFHLTDLNGPRVTNSPGFFRAANYAKDQLNRWGLVNSKLDSWETLGKDGN